jgi:hypothetical protein
MSAPTEGYVLHSYGPARYVKHAVASVHTLRRHDTERPVALFCPEGHRQLLERRGLDEHFDVLRDLPPAHRSIVGFKHHLDRFKAFDRSLFVDADIVWCRDPDPLWTQLSAYRFTATGLQRADHFFGGPKGIGVVADVLLARRRRTLQHFGLTHLPRVQAGMIYASDDGCTADVCQAASHYLDRADETHFRSRLNEGRREESCEWSLAMAMSKLELSIFPWLQGRSSPQLDYIDALTEHDRDFTEVSCRFYTVPFVYNLRGLPVDWLRDALLSVAERLPGLGDHMTVTPFALHFGWLHQKEPFYDFADRTWEALSVDRIKPRRLETADVAEPVPAE